MNTDTRMIGLDGLQCPGCGGTRSSVVDKRDKGGYLRRRRKCLHCGEMFTTKEQIASAGRGRPTNTHSDSIAKKLRALLAADADTRTQLAALLAGLDESEEAA